MEIEHCCECDEPTGRAGRADDSIYVELIRDWIRPNKLIEVAGTEIGPLCEDCLDRLQNEGLCE